MEYPTFQQIKDFTINKVRALERAGAPTSQGSTSSTVKVPGKPAQRASTYTASQGTLKNRSFPCNLCQGDHFIVMCPKFRVMSVQERRKVVWQRICSATIVVGAIHQPIASLLTGASSVESSTTPCCTWRQLNQNLKLRPRSHRRLSNAETSKQSSIHQLSSLLHTHLKVNRHHAAISRS